MSLTGLETLMCSSFPKSMLEIEKLIQSLGCQLNLQ